MSASSAATSAAEAADRVLSPTVSQLFELTAGEHVTMLQKGGSFASSVGRLQGNTAASLSSRVLRRESSSRLAVHLHRTVTHEESQLQLLHSLDTATADSALDIADEYLQSLFLMNSLDFKQAVDDQPVPVQRAPMRAQEPLDLNERLATHAHRIRQQAEHLLYKEGAFYHWKYCVLISKLQIASETSALLDAAPTAISSQGPTPVTSTAHSASQHEADQSQPSVASDSGHLAGTHDISSEPASLLPSADQPAATVAPAESSSAAPEAALDVRTSRSSQPDSDGTIHLHLHPPGDSNDDATAMEQRILALEHELIEGARSGALLSDLRFKAAVLAMCSVRWRALLGAEGSPEAGALQSPQRSSSDSVEHNVQDMQQAYQPYVSWQPAELLAYVADHEERQSSAHGSSEAPSPSSELLLQAPAAHVSEWHPGRGHENVAPMHPALSLPPATKQRLRDAIAVASSLHLQDVTERRTSWGGSINVTGCRSSLPMNQVLHRRNASDDEMLVLIDSLQHQLRAGSISAADVLTSLSLSGSTLAATIRPRGSDAGQDAEDMSLRQPLSDAALRQLIAHANQPKSARADRDSETALARLANMRGASRSHSILSSGAAIPEYAKQHAATATADDVATVRFRPFSSGNALRPGGSIIDQQVLDALYMLEKACGPSRSSSEAVSLAECGNAVPMQQSKYSKQSSHSRPSEQGQQSSRASSWHAAEIGRQASSPGRESDTDRRQSAQGLQQSSSAHALVADADQKKTRRSTGRQSTAVQKNGRLVSKAKHVQQLVATVGSSLAFVQQQLAAAQTLPGLSKSACLVHLPCLTAVSGLTAASTVQLSEA